MAFVYFVNGFPDGIGHNARGECDFLEFHLIFIGSLIIVTDTRANILANAALPFQERNS